MIHNNEELYNTVQAAVEAYRNEHENANIELKPEPNGRFAMVNNDTGFKFVFMFAKFGDEYKVGFAFYTCNALKHYEVDWIDDVFHDEFNEAYVTELIDTHLMLTERNIY